MMNNEFETRNAPASVGKSLYRAPTLTLFGSVTGLTAAGSHKVVPEKNCKSSGTASDRNKQTRC